MSEAVRHFAFGAKDEAEEKRANAWVYQRMQSYRGVLPADDPEHPSPGEQASLDWHYLTEDERQAIRERGEL